MQVNLRACDEAMTEQITNRDDANTSTHEVRCERVPQPMRRHGFTNTSATSVDANAVVYSSAR